MGRDTCGGMPGGWSCGRSEKTRGPPGLQANQSEKSALKGSVPIGSRLEKAQATYWLRQRLLLSRTKDRKSVVKGKSVSVRVDIGGSRLMKRTTHKQKT